MKKIINISLVTLLLVFAAFGQKLATPKLTPSPLTDAQHTTLREGVVLHDAKRYVEAIVKYSSILADNPDSTQALYELSLTYNAKGDKEKAMELAVKGSQYICDELPLFYVLMANNLDDVGKSKEAIDIYLRGIKLLAGDNRFGRYRSSLYYNLGVTYVKQKVYADARSAFKSAVENDYSYSSPHFFLAYVYNGTRYKIPAFMAAARYLSLDATSARARTSAQVLAEVLKPAQKDPKTGSIEINLDFNAPKDEGDFTMFDIILPTLTTVRGEKDKDKTDDEMFIDSIDTLINLAAENKKLASTFVGKNYIPFLVDLKQKGHVETLGYLVLYQNGNNLALKWLKTNDDRLKSFLEWGKAYQLPRR